MAGVGAGVGGADGPGKGIDVGRPGSCADGDDRCVCGKGMDTCAAAEPTHSAGNATEQSMTLFFTA